MGDQFTLEQQAKLNKPTIEISPTGNLVIVLPMAPAKFEQVFDEEKLTYTFHASWAE